LRYQINAIVMYTLDIKQLQQIFSDGVELGSTKTLLELGKIKPFYSQAQAHKLYGRRVVDRWIKEGLITPEKDGDKNTAYRLDRLQLDTLAKASNRISFFRNKTD
jgi:hypothetical protein